MNWLFYIYYLSNIMEENEKIALNEDEIIVLKLYYDAHVIGMFIMAHVWDPVILRFLELWLLDDRRGSSVPNITQKWIVMYQEIEKQQMEEAK